MDDSIKLERETRVKIVALPFGVGAIDDADGSLELRRRERSSNRLVGE
jgi:hypothetical protein